MRIKHIDGLRGVAIILVVLFHAYSGWPEHVPYGSAYADIPLFKHGWLGVELFFLVSGFVISITLEKTNTFKEYIYKRWHRLFPAMLIASIITYTTLGIFHERPDGVPGSFLSLLPGITFIDWWPKLLNIEIPHLEVAFWTLYIEFKFYVIAGVTYYFLGRNLLVPVLVFLFALWVLTYSLSMLFDLKLLGFLWSLCDVLSLKYFGWFGAGSIYYNYYKTADRKWLFATLLLILFSSVSVRIDTEGFNSEIIIAAMVVSALFILSFEMIFLQKILSSKILLFFGFISYPLYLIHNNAMISMTIKMESAAPLLHPFFFPYPGLICIVLTAYIIARYLEPYLRKVLTLRTIHKGG